MSMRYEFTRSGRERSLLLVFPEGSFETLPFEIRLSAPWTGQGYGDLGALKAADRWQLRQFGYVMLHESQLDGATAGAAATLSRAA
jgi:hypothetical protein